MIKEIDLKNWKQILENEKITTNSRWFTKFNEKPIFGHFLIPERSYLPKPSKTHHGIWIAEIPYQMILRFTKINDLVWSQFGGSGVDKEVCDLLERQCIITDLTPKQDYIIKADSRQFKCENKVKLILSHPPYWDMVKYSDNIADGSNISNLESFLLWWEEIIKNSIINLENNGYFVFACGNIYKNSEEINLGVLCSLIAQKHGLILKQHIIKDYGETKGKESKNYNINYYRQLKNGYGNFYGDNIFIMKKQKSKNNIINVLNNVLK